MPLTVYSQRRVKHLHLIPLSRNDCISKRKGGFYIFHSILMEKLFLQWRLNSSNSVPQSPLYRSCVSHQAAYNTLVSTNSATLWLPHNTKGTIETNTLLGWEYSLTLCFLKEYRWSTELYLRYQSHLGWAYRWCVTSWFRTAIVGQVMHFSRTFERIMTNTEHSAFINYCIINHNNNNNKPKVSI